MKFNLPELLQLHRSLLIRLAALDAVLALCSVFFLFTPLSSTSVSLNNLALLVSIVLVAVFYQMHAYRSCCGNVAYYLMLPVERLHLLPALIIIGMAPVIFVLLICACMYAALQPETSAISFTDRMLYVAAIVPMVKVLPLPFALLYKKHIVLVPAFLCILGFLYLFLMFIREMVGGIVHISNPIMALLFLCGMVVISIGVMAKMQYD